MTAVQDYVAIVIGRLATALIGRKPPGIEAVVKDDNAKSILLVVLSMSANFCQRRLPDKMLLDLWKVSIGHPTFWNETPKAHFRYSQSQRIPCSVANSLLDYSEDAVARLGVGKISIALVDEVVTLRAIFLSSIQS